MIFKHIAGFSVKFRWLIVVIWIVGTLLAVKGLPSLSGVTKNDNSAFLPNNSPSQKAAELAAPLEGGTGLESSTMVAERRSGPLTAADTAAISRAEAAVKAVAGVQSVRDQGISKDGQAHEFSIAAKSDGFSSSGLAIVGKMRSAMNGVNAPSGLSFHLTGTLASSADDSGTSNATRDSTQKYTLIFIAVLLVLVYRAALAPLITLVPAALALAVAGPIIAESTKIGVQISPITQLLLIVLMLGAGTDYGLFLVFRVREELKHGRRPADAVIAALTRVGEAITFSALTVGAALLSLLLASFGLYKGLGPALAIGLGILLLAALTLLPALLAIFGRAVFWPSNVQHGKFKLGLWGRLADRVIKHPIITLSIGIVLLGALSAGIVGYHTGGFDNGAPTSGTDSAAGADAIARHFPAANKYPQLALVRYHGLIWQNLPAIENTFKQLGASPEFASVSGLLNPGGVNLPASTISALYKTLGPPNNLPEIEPPNLRVPQQLYQLYRALGGFVSPDGHTVQFLVTLKAGASGTRAAADGIPAARNRLTHIATAVGAADSGIFSRDAFEYDVDHMASSDLKRIVPIVLLIIGALLAVLLRSLIAPWYLIASVGLSYLATLGFAMIVFVHLNSSSDGLIFILPFLLFIFCMALGEDYNILVMTRIREEAHTAPSLREAVVKAIGITGTTVTSAGLILAGTFAVLGFAGHGATEIVQIAFSIAFGIMLDTFFVRTLLVPSVAVLLGRWNWWPSALSRKSTS
jgi:putative drug exporter of the RND superfamily